MLVLQTVLADTPVFSGTILGYHIIVTQSQVVFFAIAALVGLAAEFVVGWRLPFGFIGAIIAALVGIWLLTAIIQVNIPGDFTVGGQPIIKAFLGAIVVVAIWHLVTFPRWRHRHRYYRGYRRDYE